MPDPPSAAGPPCADGPPTAADPFAPAHLGPITLRNRIIKAATFEGRTPKGAVTDDLVEFHRAVARGGVAMTTVAYCAVAPEGRTDRHQLVLRPELAPELRRLTDAVHAEGAAACAQLGHAGPVANAASNRLPALAPSKMLSPLALSVVKAATDTDIERITEAFAISARSAREAGFDAVEVHLGHNYLPSAFLSPGLNRRTDRYGGSLENRARLARQLVRAARDGAGRTLAVTAKLNMADGTARGLWLEESLQVARWLADDGAIDALELTGGSSLLNPMYLFRGDAPRREFAATLPRVARAGFGVVGRRFLRDYPYEEAYFLPYARQFRAALDLPLVLLGGISTRSTIERAMQEGFEFVAMARALLREPDLVDRMRSGRASESLCVHCNKCMPTIYRGTRCVLVTTEEFDV